MKVLKKQISNEDVTQIFISEQERDDEKIHNELNTIKNSNKNVVIFVSGKKEVKQTVKTILQLVTNRIAV